MDGQALGLRSKAPSHGRRIFLGFAAGLLGTVGFIGAQLLLDGGSAVAAPTCTVNFTNVNGGDYFTAANWTDASVPTSHRVPGSSDYACIPSSVIGAVTFSTGASSTIQGIDAEGSGLTMGAGTLTVTSTTSASTFSAVTVSGATINGAGALVITGSATWKNGTIGGTGTVTIASGATVAVTSTGNYVFLERPLTNDGTIDVSNGGYLGLQFAPSTLTNKADGVIDLQGDSANLVSWSGTNALLNSGIVKHSSGTGTTIISVPLTTSMSGVQVLTGTLSLRGGGTLSGSGTIPAGTTLDFGGGTFTVNGMTLSGAGTTVMDNATGGGTTLALATSTTTTINTTFSFSGATINGAGALVITGSATWKNGTIGGTGTVTIASGATVAVTSTGNYVFLERPLTNDGTIDVSNGGYLGLQFAPSTLTNKADGVIDLQGDSANLVSWSGTNALLNSGIVKHSSGTGTTIISVPVTNEATGEIRVDTGTLSITTLTNLSSGTLTGGTYIVTGGTLSLPSTFTTNAASLVVGVTGTISSGGTDVLPGLTVNSGSLSLAHSESLTGSLTNSGTVTINAGTLQATTYAQSAGVTTVVGGATLQAGSAGTGTITINGGTLTGNGTVTGTVSGTGTVSPGRSAGPLAVSGTYGPGSAGTLAIGISGPSVVGTDFGQLTVSGAATLKGTLAISTASGFVPSAGTTYTVLSAGSLTGTFSSVTGTSVGSEQYRVSYTSTSVVLTVLTVTSLTPNRLAEGATKFSMTVTGSGFASGATVASSNAGITFASVTVVNATTITTKASATSGVPVGTYNVTVTEGSNSATCTGCLQIDAPPTVTSLNPSTLGQGATSVKVTVSGTGFLSPAKVKFTGPSIGVTGKVTAVTTTTLTVKVTVKPGSATGTYTLKLTNGNGGTASCSNCLMVVTGPTISSISPTTVAQGQTYTFTMTGTGFSSDAKLTGPKGVTFLSIVVNGSGTMITAAMTVASTAPTGSNLPVTVTNGPLGSYGSATDDALTIT